MPGDKQHHLTQMEMKAAARHSRKQSKASKKSRRSGLKTDKPYISSSIGDMCRHMIRMACTEKTIGMTEPPPVEFYDFWRAFSWEEKQPEPVDYVDLKSVSIAKLKQFTSSFDFFGSEVSSINSANALDMTSDESETETKPIDPTNSYYNDYPERREMVTDAWGRFMESYSAESLVSHSTKADSIYEPVKGEGFEYSMGEESEYDSDEEVRELMKLQYGLNKVAVDYDTDEDSQVSLSVQDADAEKEKTKSRTKAKAMAIANAKVEHDRLLQEEEEEKKRKEDVIDKVIRVGSNDQFLLDDYSYGTLSDSVFDSEFDYFNEKATPQSVSSEKSADDEADKKKGRKRKKICGTNPKLDPERIAEEKRRIEAKLKEAVQCRSAMGSYIPPKGKPPLTNYFDSSSPGPAAYYPQQKLNKGIIMTSRWKDNIYKTIGPGPAAYNPASCLPCTAKMLNLHEGERFEKSETVGPGPAVVNISPVGKTGKEKPHAIIFPRRTSKKVGCGEGEFTNCYGLTRRGRAHPPNALIISRHPPKEKMEPGPGAYDSEKVPDRRVGIILKSRIPPLEPGMEPGFVSLPDTMGEGPKFSFGIRQFRIQNEDTPGPIYSAPPTKRKPVSLTFKPFPSRGKENEPSPVEYGQKVLVAGLKVLRKAPTALITSRRFPNFGNDKQPGPNHYNIQGKLGYDGPTIKGKREDKIEILPGPTDFVPNNKHFKCPPYAVFQHKHKEKPIKENSPGFKYTPKVQTRVLGGLIYGRWKSSAESDHAPEFQDLTGLTRNGPQTKIPLSLKSRHTPCKHNAVSTSANPPNEDPCRNATYY